MPTSSPTFSGTSVRCLRYWFGVGLAILPAVVLVAVVARKAVNIPTGDDFFTILPFLNNWLEHTSFAERWHLLIEQFTGHRLVFMRLVTLADIHLFGACNFIALQVLGWLGWIVVATALIVTLPVFRVTAWLALPVTLLLMHVEGYTNLTWAMCMGNLWVIAFAFGAAWCAFSPRRGLLMASLAFAVLSSMCFVNGLLVFPAVVIGFMLRRQFRCAAIVAGIGAVVWTIYLYSYYNPMPPIAPMEIARKAAIMAGGWVVLGRMPSVASLYAGAITLLGAGVMLSRRWLWRERPAHTTFLLFVVMTIFTAARGRSGWDDYYMLQDRYRLYGLLVLAVAYAVAVDRCATQRARLGAGGSVVAAGYCTLAYATFYAPLCAAQAWCASTALNWPLGECVTMNLPDAWPACARELARAERLGVYRLPTLLDTTDLGIIRNLPAIANGTPDCGLEPNGACAGFSVMAPADVAVHADASALPDFGVLVLPDRRVILALDVFRVRVAELLPRCSLFSERYGFLIPRSHYTLPGRYALHALGRGRDGRFAIQWSGAISFP